MKIFSVDEIKKRAKEKIITLENYDYKEKLIDEKLYQEESVQHLIKKGLEIYYCQPYKKDFSTKFLSRSPNNTITILGTYKNQKMLFSGTEKELFLFKEKSLSKQVSQFEVKVWYSKKELFLEKLKMLGFKWQVCRFVNGNYVVHIYEDIFWIERTDMTGYETDVEKYKNFDKTYKNLQEKSSDPIFNNDYIISRIKQKSYGKCDEEDQQINVNYCIEKEIDNIKYYYYACFRKYISSDLVLTETQIIDGINSFDHETKGSIDELIKIVQDNLDKVDKLK